MAAAAILNLLPVSILVTWPVSGCSLSNFSGWFDTVAAVSNFVTVSQPAAEFIAFCGKIQSGVVRHFEFVYGNSGPPTKSTYGPEVAQQIGC